MKNFKFVVVLLALVIAEGAFAGEKATTESKQCPANKTEVTHSPPSSAYEKISPNPTKDIPTSISSEVYNVSVKCVPESKKK
jgi:hypothetical protein